LEKEYFPILKIQKEKTSQILERNLASCGYGTMICSLASS
jgi:hypothetical protein